MEREEGYRNRWAVGLSIGLSVFIFTGFAFYKGILRLDRGAVAAEKPASASQKAAVVVSAATAPSPFENSKRNLEAAFGEIGKQYDILKDSLSRVLVPFVTSIEVYEREPK